MPQAERHQGHQRTLPPGIQVMGAAGDQHKPPGAMAGRQLQPDRHFIAMTAEDGIADGELRWQAAEEAAVPPDRVAAIGVGLAMAAEVVGQRLPALSLG